MAIRSYPFLFLNSVEPEKAIWKYPLPVGRE